MCGICGVVRFGGVDRGDRRLLGEMVASLRHRGPDGDGLWQDSDASLGHARLAIIDLAGGAQPMFNEDGTIAIVFNGEIYNFRELQDTLLRAGHRFRTRSDTETIVHGYEEWGDAVVQHLRGMFAFAIWDARRRRLFCARDRFGEKPFYYHLRQHDGGSIAFASEIKTLFVDPGVPRRLNGARLAEFVAFRSVAGAETLFQDILELPPAHTMVVDPGGGSLARYWSEDVDTEEPGTSHLSDGERLLSDATSCRLVSEVPLGTITSGGLDSSLVTAMAVRLAGRPLASFCVGFDDASFDERPFAREVAAAVGSVHHELVVSDEQIATQLDRLTWAHDEPLTHPNAIPMHLIFRFAKETAGVTVVLSGEGADELFGGYAWYAVARRLQRVGLLRPLRHIIPATARGRLGTLRKVLDPEYLLLANAVSSRQTVESLLADRGDWLGERRRMWPSTRAAGDALFRYDQRVYLPPLLQRQDRMSMAAGVEARVVFLDHALAEWANRLPAERKLAGGTTKAVLREIARRWIPPRILDRPKVGFTLPLGDWLRRTGRLAGRVDALGDASSFVGTLVGRTHVIRMIREHEARLANHADVLWTLIALDTWARTFLGPSVLFEQLPGAATGRALPVAASLTASPRS